MRTTPKESRTPRKPARVWLLAGIASCVGAGALAFTLTRSAGNGGAEGAWALIEDIEYQEHETDTSWSVEKSFSPALRDAAADEFAITGYYVPVEAQPYVTQFLLVPSPEDCPFCGSNGYGPALEVSMKRPMPDMPEATQITLRGTLNLDNSPETYRAVYMTGARLVD